MGTNRIALRTVEQFMTGFTPIYQPILPLFLGKSQQYAPEVGIINMRRVQTVGDLRAKHILPKDTEIKQINVQEGLKVFKKYFLGTQYIQSGFQNLEGAEDAVGQVLDEHHVQSDSMLLDGEGYNNGLYTSNDPYYTLENSVEVEKDGDGNYLLDLHAKVMSNARKANQVAGRKVIIFFGTNILPLFDGLHPLAVTPFKVTIQETLGANYNVIAMPVACTPANANGWLIANIDQLKLHYTKLAALDAQGYNEEKSYYWFNFLMGSSMLEVLALNGVIRQPATLQA